MMWIKDEVVFSTEWSTNEFLQVMTAHDKVPKDNENTDTNNVGDWGNTQINNNNNKFT